LERWFLTAHERTAITTATKELCGICNSDSKPAHKEAGLSRDEEHVKKLITTVLSVMSNPFDMGSVDDGVTVPLSNLETGVVMPQDIATRLHNAEKLGMQEMNSFLTKRITSNETGFWDTLPKMKIKTFASMVKKVLEECVQALPRLLSINSDEPSAACPRCYGFCVNVEDSWCTNLWRNGQQLFRWNNSTSRKKTTAFE